MTRGTDPLAADVAVIGGSGLYGLAGLDDCREATVPTPFGEHSDGLRVGRVDGRTVAFLSRHGRHHRLLPSEVNYRANVYALKALGVTRILSVGAVGSMRESIRPRDVVLVDQFIDRTHQRPMTFFGGGIAAHVALADPVCPVTRRVLHDALAFERARVHDGGTYVCIEGPAFSTRAESRLYRSWNVDVIGMTNAHEARLAREAEICYATMAMVTDYDCWHEEEQDVTVTGVLENLRANAELAARAVRAAIAGLPSDRQGCDCARALDHAVITARDAIDGAAIERLGPLLARYLGRGGAAPQLS